MPEEEKKGFWQWIREKAPAWAQPLVNQLERLLGELTGKWRSLSDRVVGYLVGKRQNLEYFFETFAKRHKSYGTFAPEPQFQLLLHDGELGKNGLLHNDFTYSDPEGKQWPTRKSRNKDDVYDGASIPRMCWDVVGTPLNRPYCFAAIVHDYYCARIEPHLIERTWKDVHRMFYFACLAGGVAPTEAKVMFAGVYAFGPRWGWVQADGSISQDPIPGTLIERWQETPDEIDGKKLVAWVRYDAKYPDVEHIIRHVEQGPAVA